MKMDLMLQNRWMKRNMMRLRLIVPANLTNDVMHQDPLHRLHVMSIQRLQHTHHARSNLDLEHEDFYADTGRCTCQPIDAAMCKWNSKVMVMAQNVLKRHQIQITQS